MSNVHCLYLPCLVVCIAFSGYRAEPIHIVWSERKVIDSRDYDLSEELVGENYPYARRRLLWERQFSKDNTLVPTGERFSAEALRDKLSTYVTAQDREKLRKLNRAKLQSTLPRLATVDPRVSFVVPQSAETTNRRLTKRSVAAFAKTGNKRRDIRRKARQAIRRLHKRWDVMLSRGRKLNIYTLPFPKQPVTPAHLIYFTKPDTGVGKDYEVIDMSMDTERDRTWFPRQILLMITVIVVIILFVVCGCVCKIWCYPKVAAVYDNHLQKAKDFVQADRTTVFDFGEGEDSIFGDLQGPNVPLTKDME